MRRQLLTPLLLLSCAIGFALPVASLARSSDSQGLAAVLRLGEPFQGSVALLDSTVSDPRGDALPLQSLWPFPERDRGMTIHSTTATLVVPAWLLDDPQSFEWVAATGRPSTEQILDAAPNGTTQTWRRGTSSETADEYMDHLLPHHDLGYARVRQFGLDAIEFTWRCRGGIPQYAADTSLFIYVYPRYYLSLISRDAEWSWFVSISQDAHFPWKSTAYEDILSVSVTRAGDDELTFAMTVAADIPAAPADDEGYPSFTWAVNPDPDAPDGGDADFRVVVQWDPELGGWTGVLSASEGQGQGRGVEVPFDISGPIVSATVNASDLGVSLRFSWRAWTTVVAGPAGEQFYNAVDYAPDTGWVEDVIQATPTPTTTPTPTATPIGPWNIYLPLVQKAAAQ